MTTAPGGLVFIVVDVNTVSGDPERNIWDLCVVLIVSFNLLV